MSQTLYSLADELRRIGDELESNGGELTPELEAALNATEGAFEAKVEACLCLAQEREQAAEAAKAEAARLADLASSRTKAVDRLRLYVKQQMEAAGRLKVETPLFKVAVQNASRPSIRWTWDMEALPEAFVKVIPATSKLDSDAALKAYKEGHLPEGFEVSTSTFLRVR